MDQGCMFTYTTTKHTQTMFRLNFKHIHHKNPTLNTNIYLQVNWYSNGFPIGKDMQLQLVDICWPCLTTWRVNGTLWLYCEVCKHNGIVPSWGFLLFKTHDQIRCLIVIQIQYYIFNNPVGIGINAIDNCFDKVFPEPNKLMLRWWLLRKGIIIWLST